MEESGETTRPATAASSIHVHARSARGRGAGPTPSSRCRAPETGNETDSMRNFAPAAEGARVYTSARARTRKLATQSYGSGSHIKHGKVHYMNRKRRPGT